MRSWWPGRADVGEGKVAADEGRWEWEGARQCVGHCEVFGLFCE